MKKIIVPIIIVIFVLLYSSLFIVKEGNRAIVTRFGEILKSSNNSIADIIKPGLHFKLPLFDKVTMLSALIQTMDEKSDRFFTREKKDVIIDYYVKWKIQDFGKFFLATGGGNLANANNLLQKRVVDLLRGEIGKQTISDIVSEKRDQTMQTVLKSVQKSGQSLGIEVIDARIKKINLPDEISESIYARMRAERNSIATQYRSEGKEQAERIKADANLAVAKILADANKKALIIKGKADASVAKMYVNAFKNYPDFYSFVRSLQAYQQSFDSKQDVMILNPNTDFFKFMKAPNKQ